MGTECSEDLGLTPGEHSGPAGRRLRGQRGVGRKQDEWVLLWS